jgi:hypothetical protein
MGSRETKYDTLVIEACLTHKVGGIERHYLRTTFLEQRRKLVKDWDSICDSRTNNKYCQNRFRLILRREIFVRVWQS